MNEKSMICLSDFIKKARDGAAVLITDSVAALSCHRYVWSEQFLITAVVKWATFTVITWLWYEYCSVSGGIGSHLVIFYALTAVISAVIMLACLLINKQIILVLLWPSEEPVICFSLVELRANEFILIRVKRKSGRFSVINVESAILEMRN